MPRKSKSVREFINENKTELDAAITSARNVGRKTPLVTEKLNNTDRHEWLLNDAGLYSWARSAGVNL